MEARNRVGIGYRPARLHGLAESIPGLLKSGLTWVILPCKICKAENNAYYDTMSISIYFHKMISVIYIQIKIRNKNARIFSKNIETYEGIGFYSAPVSLAKTPPQSLLLIVFPQSLVHCKK
jgi:hypothetical protein